MNICSDISSAMTSFSRDEDSGKVTATFSFHKDLPVFGGHFPQMPLLPGVMQIEMVRRTAAKALALPCTIAVIKKVKFASPVYPGKSLLAEIDLAPPAAGEDLVKVRARLSEGGKEACRIVMYLKPEKAKQTA